MYVLVNEVMVWDTALPYISSKKCFFLDVRVVGYYFKVLLGTTVSMTSRDPRQPVDFIGPGHDVYYVRSVGAKTPNLDPVYTFWVASMRGSQMLPCRD